MKWAASHLKISWILALLLLIGCLLGANHIMNGSRGINPFNRQPPDGKTPAKPASGQHFAAVTTGIASPSGDTIPLFPSAAGEAVEVLAKSGDHVKKGQVLLRVNDRLQRNALKQAETAVEIATTNLGIAKDALERFPNKRQMQERAIELAKSKWKIQSNIVNDYANKRAHDLKIISDTDFENAKELQKALEIGVKTEEDKLKEIDDNLPTVKAQVQLAKSSLSQAETNREKAQLFVDHCVLKAPEDGTIMQSYVAVGSKFGEQAVMPAFQFYTGGLIIKANIPQEKAGAVKEGQRVIVEDAAGNSDQTWQGEVTKVDNKFTVERKQGAIPGLNDQVQDPVLECRITLDAGKPLPLLNQKVRVKFLK